MIFKIKIIIGIILPIFLFLPIGSCVSNQVVVSEEHPSASIEKPAPVKSEKSADYLVLIERVSKTEPGTWLSLFVFIWPLPFLLFKRFVNKSKWRKRVANIFEALFLAFSIYFLFFVIFSCYTPTKWGYLAGILICFYTLIFLVEIFLPLIKYNTRFHDDALKNRRVWSVPLSVI